MTLGRVLPDATPVVVLSDLGSPGQQVVTTTLQDLPNASVGPRTTVYVDPPPAGW
ncbi:MAG: hypothetical protein GWM91_24535, partial [Actinobacteria bacterium]|nr:hypothetical protein [Actinomycetota bacterium]NIX53363.1 hypothetical protein [Actinomycetota bacterium]